MDIKQLNELDFSNVGDWPGIVKSITIILLCGAIAGAWYYFDTSVQLGKLASAEGLETELRAALESKHHKAVNLDPYRQQLEEMKETFGAMLRQLPDTTEVAALLVDVSQTGLAAGLEFELFQPSGELLKEFYAEMQIQIRSQGSYHEFGRFISGLAALPRIVTIHDVSITHQGAPGLEADSGLLTLTATVKTYRYLEEVAAR